MTIMSASGVLTTEKNLRPALELAVDIRKVGAKPGARIARLHPGTWVSAMWVMGQAGPSQRTQSCAPLEATVPLHSSSAAQLPWLSGPPWTPEASLEWCFLYR